MPIIFKDWITREFVQAHPNDYFVFGDNAQRVGLGGQAKAMRGEPNAIGVATKRAPDMEETSFYADTEEDIRIVSHDLAKVILADRAGYTIYVPTDGLGTGLAQLPSRSPYINKLIVDCFKSLSKDCPW